MYNLKNSWIYLQKINQKFFSFLPILPIFNLFTTYIHKILPIHNIYLQLLSISLRTFLFRIYQF